MHDFPHRYTVSAAARAEGPVEVTSPGLSAIESAPPAEFGGPGNLWSPETLLVAAVADCFVLSFKAVARASRMEWRSIRCDVEGVLERPDRAIRFTGFRLRVRLDMPGGTDESRAMRVLEKAEQSCLITNSLNSEVHLDAQVVSES